MAEFLTSQLDYVYFAYGLALVLLGSIAASIPRGAPGGLPWAWLAAFAFCQGAVEWLRLVGLFAGDHPALQLTVAVLLLGSYLLLAEFARCSHAAVRGASPGRWLTWGMAVPPVAVALAWGPASLAPATRFLLALPASLWAAFLVGAASRRAHQSGEDTAGPLEWVAFFIALHGVAAGLVVPATPPVPAGWPTAEAFLAASGVPVQAVRGTAIAGATIGLWAYATALAPQGRVLRKRWRFFWGFTISLVLVLAAGWQMTDRLGRQHEEDLQAEAEAASAQVEGHLFMEIQGADDAVRTALRLVSSFGLGPGIARGGSPELDAVVDAIAGVGKRQVAFVLDPSGRVVASSDRGRPGSLLGQGHASRPYFLDAMNGSTGRFIGAGDAGEGKGFYASGQVRDGRGSLIGVAAVRQALDRESFGAPGNGTSFLVGRDGQVLLVGTDEFPGRPMWGDGKGAVGGTRPLLPASWAGSTWARIDGVRYVAVRAQLPALDWSVVTLRKEQLRGTHRLLGILVTLLLSTAIAASFVILQRQLGAESHLAEKRREAEGRAREMARRADTDALTGIANRQGFDEAIAREFARGRRFRHPLAIVFADLDHFKRVNDRYGHPVGDQVLAAVASMLSARVRESDFVARWGGEEFAIITSMTDAAGAVRLAEKLRALMEATQLGPAGAMTASFGVAEMRAEDTVQSMLQRADAALYAAKEGGRNQVRCAEAWVDMEVIAAAEAGAVRGAPAYMETGFAPIDAEHRKLSGSLSGLVALVDAGDTTAVRSAMAWLVEEVAEHFAHEEELMRRHDYPSRPRHEEAHMLFVGDAKRFQAELERSGVTAGFRQWASTRLPEWFRYHILAHDVSLGRFLSGTPGPGPHSSSKAR